MKLSLVTGTLFALTLCATAHAQQPIVIKFSHVVAEAFTAKTIPSASGAKVTSRDCWGAL